MIVRMGLLRGSKKFVSQTPLWECVFQWQTRKENLILLENCVFLKKALWNTNANYLGHEVQKSHCFIPHYPHLLCTCWKLVKFLLKRVKKARAFWQTQTPLINVKMHAFIERIILLYAPFHVGLGRVIQESFNLKPGFLILRRAVSITWRETEGAALSSQ